MIKMIRSTEPTEHQIQCAIVEWANNIFVQHPNLGQVCLGQYLIKIPNEGKRSWAQGKKMKKEGLKKGVSDLFFAFPIVKYVLKQGKNVYYSGLWIELKKKGKKATDEQLEFLARMQELGYKVACKDSVDEGIQSIKDYLGMK